MVGGQGGDSLQDLEQELIEVRELELVEVPCDLCSQSQSRSVAIRADGLSVVTCESCGLLFLSPRPADEKIPLLYEASYFGDSNSTESTYTTEYLANSLWADRNVPPEKTSHGKVFLEIEQILRRKGRVLDVGCSIGSALNTARKLGWETMGVEPSEFAASLSRQHFGIDPIVATLESAMLPKEHFDAITMFDVIEHVTSPRGTLREIARLLRPDGVLYLLTPNGANIAARGASWIGLRVNMEHLYYFTAASLSGLLTSAGLKMSSYRTTGRTSLERSLVRDPGWARARRALSRVPALYYPLRMGWRFVNALPKRRDEATGLGHGLEVYARPTASA